MYTLDITRASTPINQQILLQILASNIAQEMQFVRHSNILLSKQIELHTVFPAYIGTYPKSSCVVECLNPHHNIALRI